MENIVPSNKILKINDLIEGLKLRQLPFLGELYTLINRNDKHKAYRTIEAILRKSLLHFEVNFPLSISSFINITDNKYIFMDNFNGYIKGTVAEQNIELIPTVVHTVGGGPTSYSISSNYWDYIPPMLCVTSGGSTVVRYYAHYPVYIQYHDDGGFTDDSIIWGIDQVRYFEDQFDLDMLSAIKRFEDTVRFQGLSVDFINLDQSIQSLMQSVEENNSYSDALLDAWR